MKQPVFEALKKLIIFLGVLVALGYIGNLLIDNPYVHRLLRDALNERLETNTHLSIKFQAINAKFIPPGFDIYGVDVRYQKPDGAEQSLAQLAHLQLRFSIIALLLSQSEIFDLEINEPRISLPLPPTEDLIKIDQFPDWNKKSDLADWPLVIPMPMKHARIGNATINVKIADTLPDAPDLLSMQLEGLNLDFTFQSWQKFELGLQLKRGNISIQGAKVIQDLSLQLMTKQDKDQLVSQILSLESDDLQSTGQLRVAYETEPKKLRGTLQDKNAKLLKGVLIQINNQISRADIGILGRYLNITGTEGRVFGKTELQIHIPFDDRTISWRLDGKAQSESAKIDGFKLLDTQLDFSINDEGMNFEDAKIISGKRELARGSGFIGFTKGTPFNFDIKPKNLPFVDLMSVLKVDGFEAFSAELNSPEIKLQGQAIPFSMQISGLAKFSQVSLPFVSSLPKRFLEPPSCLFQTVLQIDTQAVAITQGDGHCWKSIGKDQELPAEQGSPVKLLGKFFFSTEEGIDLKIESPSLDTTILEHFTKLPSQGLVSLQTRIKGPYDHIAVSGTLSGQNLSVGGFDVEEAASQFQLSLDSNQLQIPELKLLLKDQGRLDLHNFSMQIASTYPFKTEIDAQNVPPSFLTEGLRQTFQIADLSLGFKTLHGKVQGRLLQPFSYLGSLDFALSDLTLGPEELLSEASGVISSSDKNWSLTKGYLRLSQLEARLGFEVERRGGAAGTSNIFHRLGINPSDKVRMTLKTINQNLNNYRTNEVSQEINHLSSLPYIGSFLKAQRFGGQIQLDADIEGPIDHLQGKVEGSLEQPYIWGIPISSFNLAGFIDGWKLHIPELRHSGNALVGRLNIDFGSPDLPYDWYFYFNQMDIRALLGKHFAEDPRNFAYLTAEWTMSGKLKNFWASQGDLVLSRVRSKLFRNLGSRTSSVELNSDDAIKLKISSQGWTLPDKRPLKLQGEFFDLSFEAGNNIMPDQLDLSMHGSIKLDILKNFSNVIETARGELVIDGYLRGSLAKPDLSIKFREKRLDPFNVKEWQPVSIGLVDYGPALSNISMDVEVKDDRVIVNRFKASKGREGSLAISGQLNLGEDGEKTSRLSIDIDRMEFNRLAVPILKTADLTLSGNLIVTGHSLPLSLSGDLTIDRLQSIGNFDLRKQIVSSIYDPKLSSATANAGSTSQAPLLLLDVAVVADKSITIKNKTLEAILSADLHVHGTDTQPLLLGQILADRGTFNYRRNFKINQAVISFDELVSPPNPRLDIIGETTVSPYKVEVLVNGNLQNPRVQLTVDPPNRDDGFPISNLDILLLISTGRIPEQANKTAEKASFNELISFFAVFAEEPIEKLFDLSGQTVIREVYFDSYLSETEQRPITRVNFPIRLGDNINAVLQVDDEANTKVSLEYQIHEGITVSGSLDKGGSKPGNGQKNLPADSGFDLKFRFGFD